MRGRGSSHYALYSVEEHPLQSYDRKEALIDGHHLFWTNLLGIVDVSSKSKHELRSWVTLFKEEVVVWVFVLVGELKAAETLCTEAWYSYRCWITPKFESIVLPNTYALSACATYIILIINVFRWIMRVKWLHFGLLLNLAWLLGTWCANMDSPTSTGCKRFLKLLLGLHHRLRRSESTIFSVCARPLNGSASVLWHLRAESFEELVDVRWEGNQEAIVLLKLRFVVVTENVRGRCNQIRESLKVVLLELLISPVSLHGRELNGEDVQDLKEPALGKRMSAFFQILCELEDCLVELGNWDFIALCKQLLDVIQEVRIEELAEQGLLLDKLPRQDQLLLRLWCDCLPLLLLNEVVDALYNVIVLYFHRLKYLHDLFQVFVHVSSWVKILLVHPDKQDALYQLVWACVGQGSQEI